MKARIKNYLSISKKEWNGMVILVILIACVLAAPYIYQWFHKDNTINLKDFDKEVAQLKAAGYDTAGNSSASEKIVHPVMFPFNPNTLTVQQWQQLGLSAKQADIIERYIAKGGRFYAKEDLKKIYALNADDYQRLAPYVNIPDEEYRTVKLKPGQVIELNSTDSAKLTEVHGIGPGFAVRIIRYRNRLGGFYNKEQLKEIYGVDSLMYAEIQGQLKVDPYKVKRININTISFDQLRIFPYLNYKQVNAIIQYRVQHGPYASIADMRNIVILDDKILRKIEPYLSFK